MARCTRTRNLEVHHKRRDGGNGLDNVKYYAQIVMQTQGHMVLQVNHLNHLVRTQKTKH